jgi:hypothetical protein
MYFTVFIFLYIDIEPPNANYIVAPEKLKIYVKLGNFEYCLNDDLV